MKKVLVISSSLRPGSNSEILADSFARGAKEKKAVAAAYEMGKQI